MAGASDDRGRATDRNALEVRRRVAGALAGQRIARVHYVDIDYRGWELGFRDQSRRRTITDTGEWSDPTWDAGWFHHVDFGVELTTDDGEMFTITWDPPMDESLVLRPGTANDVGAVWDVSGREPWATCLRHPLSGIELRYHPWGEPGGYWCSRATLTFGESRVEVLLGDSGDDPSVIEPSADNIAVLFDGGELPTWESTDDLV